MADATKKKWKEGEPVRCKDTGDLGRVVSFNGEVPIVKFSNGAVGPCNAAEKP